MKRRNLIILVLIMVIGLTGCVDNPSPTQKQLEKKHQQKIKKIENIVNENAKIYIHKAPVELNTIFNIYAEYKKNIVKKWDETTLAYKKRILKYKNSIDNIYVVKASNYKYYYNADLKKTYIGINNNILGKEYIGSTYASNGYELKHYNTLKTEIPTLQTYPNYEHIGYIKLDGTYTPSEHLKLTRDTSMI